MNERLEKQKALHPRAQVSEERFVITVRVFGLDFPEGTTDSKGRAIKPGRWYSATADIGPRSRSSFRVNKAQAISSAVEALFVGKED